MEWDYRYWYCIELLVEKDSLPAYPTSLHYKIYFYSGNEKALNHVAMYIDVLPLCLEFYLERTLHII